MAKIGIEVEGRLQGKNVVTYFCSADEYMDNEDIFEDLNTNGVEMIYISDHHNELDLQALADRFAYTGIIVTVELTELTEIAPIGVEIFWNASQASYAQSRTIQFLRPQDQVKVENEKFVMAWTVPSAYITLPEDFEGDVEV